MTLLFNSLLIKFDHQKVSTTDIFFFYICSALKWYILCTFNSQLQNQIKNDPHFLHNCNIEMTFNGTYPNRCPIFWKLYIRLEPTQEQKGIFSSSLGDDLRMIIHDVYFSNHHIWSLKSCCSLKFPHTPYPKCK